LFRLPIARRCRQNWTCQPISQNLPHPALAEFAMALKMIKLALEMFRRGKRSLPSAPASIGRQVMNHITGTAPHPDDAPVRSKCNVVPVGHSSFEARPVLYILSRRQSVLVVHCWQEVSLVVSFTSPRTDSISDLFWKGTCFPRRGDSSFTLFFCCCSPVGQRGIHFAHVQVLQSQAQFSMCQTAIMLAALQLSSYWGRHNRVFP
jgi:hypothetical protein